MILELENICKEYMQGKIPVPVLKNINFSMEEGEYVAIMGPSGSGKTTLMNIVGCLDQATSGRLILDETDSGLDIDALRIVATGVTKLHRADNATVVITHYQRLLDYIVPDVVHVLYKGRIIYSGDKSLALKLEKEGYDWLINEYDK